MLVQYGRRFVRSDSETALHYYMLAADAAGGSMVIKGKLFRELLVESKDYGRSNEEPVMSAVCAFNWLRPIAWIHPSTYAKSWHE